MASLLHPQPFLFQQHHAFVTPRLFRHSLLAPSQRFIVFHSLLSRSNCYENLQFPFLKDRACTSAFGATPLVSSKLLTASVAAGCTSAKLLQIPSEAPSSVDSDTFPSTSVSTQNLAPLDAEVKLSLPRSSIVDGYGPKVNLPPRICTLREFRKFGEEIFAVESDEALSAFFKSLAASIEFSAKIQDWEILSGRLAMIVFVSAVLVEALTGNSVFQKLDPQRLLEIFTAVVFSIFGAAAYALAWQAKGHVPYKMSEGYEYLINAMIDKVIDDLLFDDEAP